MAISTDNPSICERPGGLVKNLAIVGLVFTPFGLLFGIAFCIAFMIYTTIKEQDELYSLRGGATRPRLPVLV